LQHWVRAHPQWSPRTLTPACADARAHGGGRFLIGPRRQCRNMFQSNRIQATLIYLSMMVRAPPLAAHTRQALGQSTAPVATAPVATASVATAPSRRRFGRRHPTVGNRDLRLLAWPKAPRAALHRDAVVRGCLWRERAGVSFSAAPRPAGALSSGTWRRTSPSAGRF
jgi:hypothetical protein